MKLDSVVLTAILHETVAADQTAPVLAYRNGSNEGDDTLTVPDGTARGAIVSKAIDDSAGYDYFDVDDPFDFFVKTAAVDAGTEAGEAHGVARVLQF